MDSDWQVVFTADGAVLAVSGGAPAEWMGTALTDRSDLPDGLRQAVVELLRQLHTSSAVFAQTRFTASNGGRTIHLLAIEAIPLRRRAIDLQVLLASAIGTMREQARTVEVDLRLQVDQAAQRTVWLDADKVAWIITTLIGNALRYVRHGSRVLPGGVITVRGSGDSDGSEVSISVEDDGPGIPDQVFRHLFQPPTDRPLALGLSLKIAFDIVSAHGGRLEVDSRRDAETSGTTVRFSLPARA
jgi:signal transduction histidine kinase